MTQPLLHTALISEGGAQDITHPEPDHGDCDFEAYLAADWFEPTPMFYGPWRFSRMDGYWNGAQDAD